MPLLAEDLLLLLLDDESGRMRTFGQTRALMGGALLLDLALDRVVRVDDSSSWRPPHVLADPAATPPEDPLLSAALAGIGSEERRAVDVVYRVGKGVEDQVLDRLVASGQVRREEGRVLGVFPRTVWPAAQVDHEQEVLRDLVAVLTSGATPTPRSGALITLLYANGRIAQAFDHPAMSNGDIRARAKEVIHGAWAEDDVRQALTGTNTAIAAVTSS